MRRGQGIERKEEVGKNGGTKTGPLAVILTEFPSIAVSNGIFAIRIIMREGEYRVCAELKIVSHERIN